MKTKTAVLSGLAALAVVSSSYAQSSLVLGLGTVFSGTTSPSTSVNPWITASFVNSGTGANQAGQVTLTMTVANLPASEYVKGIYFNLAPALNATNLNISGVTTTAATATISTGVNAFQADGDGMYDIRFEFPAANGAARFTANETLVYNLTYNTGYALTAGDFNTLSAPAGGKGPFVTAAHIPGIPVSTGTTSAWVTAVPEPSTYALALGALAGLGVWFQRRSAAAKA
jgi:hypothetical protein